MPLWLSEQDVRAALSMQELIEAMESALIAFSSGRVVQPVRMTLELRERAFLPAAPPVPKRTQSEPIPRLRSVPASKAPPAHPVPKAKEACLGYSTVCRSLGGKLGSP